MNEQFHDEFPQTMCNVFSASRTRSFPRAVITKGSDLKGTARRSRLSKERDGHCQVGLNRDSSLVKQPLIGAVAGGRGRCHQPWQAKLELPAAPTSNAALPVFYEQRAHANKPLRSRPAWARTCERLIPPRKMRRDRSQRLTTYYGGAPDADAA